MRHQKGQSRRFFSHIIVLNDSGIPYAVYDLDINGNMIHKFKKYKRQTMKSLLENIEKCKDELKETSDCVGTESEVMDATSDLFNLTSSNVPTIDFFNDTNEDKTTSSEDNKIPNKLGNQKDFHMTPEDIFFDPQPEEKPQEDINYFYFL